MEHPCVQELCYRNLEGGATLLGIRKDMWRSALETGIPLHGDPLGAWKGAHLTGTHVLKKALEPGISLHRGPIGNLGGVCLPVTLRGL